MASFEEIVHDLLNLEINTIVKKNMTAQKMPSTPHVLLDIANDYLQYMINLGLDPTPYWATTTEGGVELRHIPKRNDPEGRRVKLWIGTPPPFDTTQLRNGEEDFGHLRWLAVGLAINPDFAGRLSAQKLPVELQVLQRITRNCDEIREMVRCLVEKSSEKDAWAQFLGKGRRDVIQAIRSCGSPPVLNVVDSTKLRKIREIGTEHVVLQTVIQVDGDVISRVHDDLASAESKLLFEIHLHSIKTSVESWRFLVDLVAKLAGRTVDTLVGGRS